MVMQYITQFDKPDLGVHTIADFDMVPISDSGTNWQMYREQFLAYQASLSREMPEESQEIPTRMLQYKVIVDKHDAWQLNTLQDLDA